MTGPVGGAGELTALLERRLDTFAKATEKHLYHKDVLELVRFIKPIVDELAALAAKAPQGVPHSLVSQLKDYIWQLREAGNYRCTQTANDIERMLDADASPKLPAAGPVSDDTIHHGMVPPRCQYCEALWERDEKTMKHRHPSVAGFGAFAYKCEAAAPKPASPTESEVEAAKASMRSRGVVCDAVSTPHPYAICSCTEGHRNARLAEPIVSPSPAQDELSPEEVAGIKQGLEDVAAGRVTSLKQIKSELAATPAPGAERLRERITEYLAHGGLFNPESVEHAKVRDLLIEVREALAAAPPASPYIQDFNAQRGRGIFVVTGEHQRTAFFDKEAAEKYLAGQNHERFKIVEYSKPAPQFGPGDYSCAVCGLGMVEPCEHWKEAAEVKELIRRGHASAERVRELAMSWPHDFHPVNEGTPDEKLRHNSSTCRRCQLERALPPSTGEKQ